MEKPILKVQLEKQFIDNEKHLKLFSLIESFSYGVDSLLHCVEVDLINS